MSIDTNLCEDRRHDCGQTCRFTQLILTLQDEEQEEEVVTMSIYFDTKQDINVNENAC